MSTSSSDKNALFKRGLLVAVGLAVLSVVEYFASNVAGAAMPLLCVLALAKAGLILEFFMHFGKVFQSNNADGDH